MFFSDLDLSQDITIRSPKYNDAVDDGQKKSSTH